MGCYGCGTVVMASGSGKKENGTTTPYLGPEYSIDEMRQVLDRYGAVYHRKESTSCELFVC